MNYTTPKEEILARQNNLITQLTAMDEDWDTIILIGRVNIFYLTGTMQDGILVIRRNGYVYYFVRKSYRRACAECPVEIIRKMTGYKDMLQSLPEDLGKTYIDMDIFPLIALDRLKKYFNISAIKPIDRLMQSVRSVKSPYELQLIEESGKCHEKLFEEIPGLLKEGMTEAELTGEIYNLMIKLGYQGISRFNMFQTEMVVGQLGFGESSLYPSSFDGPAGMKGMYPAVSIVGSRERRLKKGDLVFVDIGFGIKGYHTDKTQVFSFGAAADEKVKDIHKQCMNIQKVITDLMKPGAIPSEIYAKALAAVPEELQNIFMNSGEESVKFVGHGVGLHIDEFPVLAKGFNEPLQENMIISIEPKCGLESIGMVGVEETFVVTSDGCRCITGGCKEIVAV